METEQAVTLYLESWQKRMLKDFASLKQIKKEITKVTIRPGKGGCPTSYKIVPGSMNKEDWWIYLTDEQMLQVKEQLHLRTAVTFVNVTADTFKSGAVAFG